MKYSVRTRRHSHRTMALCVCPAVGSASCSLAFDVPKTNQHTNRTQVSVRFRDTLKLGTTQPKTEIKIDWFYSFFRCHFLKTTTPHVRVYNCPRRGTFELFQNNSPTHATHERHIDHEKFNFRIFNSQPNSIGHLYLLT